MSSEVEAVKVGQGFLFKISIMIYKFEDCIGGSTVMEVQMYSGGIDFVSFCIKEVGDDENYISVNINKEDVYGLIGALHLLHKKMQ